MGNKVSYPGVKTAGGRENNHSRKSSAEVKNAWKFTSSPPIRQGLVLN